VEKNRLDFLTSLKGIAAWGIVLFHIKDHLLLHVPYSIYVVIEKGFLFVDFFFISSGIIISYNYFHSLSGLNGPRVKQFYLKRLIRIYPLHFLMLVAYISVLAVIIYSGRGYKEFVYSGHDFVFNLFLIHNWGFTHHFSWNIPSWAVSVEIAAYLIFPFIASIYIKFKNRFSILSIILFCAIIYTVYSLGDCKSIGDSIPRLGIVRGLSEFLIGMNLYILYNKFKEVQAIEIVGAFLLGTGAFGIYMVLYMDVSNIIFFPISLTAFIAGLLVFSDEFSALLGNKLLIYIGKISYSTYMIHFFLRDVFKLLFLKSEITPISWIISYGLFLLLCSHISYRYIEIPIAKFAKGKLLK